MRKSGGTFTYLYLFIVRMSSAIREIQARALPSPPGRRNLKKKKKNQPTAENHKLRPYRFSRRFIIVYGCRHKCGEPGNRELIFVNCFSKWIFTLTFFFFIVGMGIFKNRLENMEMMSGNLNNSNSRRPLPPLYQIIYLSS